MPQCKKGFKKQRNKCVRIRKKTASSKKLSKNPFKMWGSYVGAVMGVILGWFITAYITAIFVIGTLGTINPTTIIYVGLIVSLIIGFLLGWGIHLLLRKLGWVRE